MSLFFFLSFFLVFFLFIYFYFSLILLSPEGCINSGCLNGACTPTGYGQGQFTCACHAGWTGTLCNTDINECLIANACGGNAYCTNTPGSYYCTCNTGYGGNPAYGSSCTGTFNSFFASASSFLFFQSFFSFNERLQRVRWWVWFELHL